MDRKQQIRNLAKAVSVATAAGFLIWVGFSVLFGLLKLVLDQSFQLDGVWDSDLIAKLVIMLISCLIVLSQLLQSDESRSSRERMVEAPFFLLFAMTAFTSIVVASVFISTYSYPLVNSLFDVEIFPKHESSLGTFLGICAVLIVLHVIAPALFSSYEKRQSNETDDGQPAT